MALDERLPVHRTCSGCKYPKQKVCLQFDTVLSGQTFRLQNLLVGWHLKAIRHCNNLLPPVIISDFKTCLFPYFSKITTLLI